MRQNNPAGKSFLIFRNRVNPGNQKYSASVTGANQRHKFACLTRQEGRIAIVTNVRWDAVDARVSITNGAHAYDKNVWS